MEANCFSLPLLCPFLSPPFCLILPVLGASDSSPDVRVTFTTMKNIILADNLPVHPHLDGSGSFSTVFCLQGAVTREEEVVPQAAQAVDA